MFVLDIGTFLLFYVLMAHFVHFQGIFVLNCFRERLNSQRLYAKIRDFMFEQRAMELRDLYKEVMPPAPWDPAPPSQTGNTSVTATSWQHYTGSPGLSKRF